MQLCLQRMAVIRLSLWLLSELCLSVLRSSCYALLSLLHVLLVDVLLAVGLFLLCIPALGSVMLRWVLRMSCVGFPLLLVVICGCFGLDVYVFVFCLVCTAWLRLSAVRVSWVGLLDFEVVIVLSMHGGTTLCGRV